jgi:hypothetical protein
MNRSEAKRILSRKFRSRPGKGDHLLFFDGSKFVFGLSVSTGSNGKDLPRSIARQVRELCQ